jgi:hypothetical protein
MKIINNDDVFRVVNNIDDVPKDYQIWNIGRHNFDIKNYIPMARVNKNEVDTTSLIALYIESETKALQLMKLNHRKTLDVEAIKLYL